MTNSHISDHTAKYGKVKSPIYCLEFSGCFCGFSVTLVGTILALVTDESVGLRLLCHTTRAHIVKRRSPQISTKRRLPFSVLLSETKGNCRIMIRRAFSFWERAVWRKVVDWEVSLAQHQWEANWVYRCGLSAYKTPCIDFLCTERIWLIS